MASNTSQPTLDPNTASSRPIPLVSLRRPTMDASSSISFDSSSDATLPSTPASLTPPTSAHDSSPTSSPERLSRQTTCVSGTSASPVDSLSLVIGPPQLSPPTAATAPRSVPDRPQPQNQLQRQSTWQRVLPPWAMPRWDHRRTWLQNAIGLAALAVALVGMFVYALRGYKLAKWTAYNDLLQVCVDLLQANRDGGLKCKLVLEEGPRERPYDKRSLLRSFATQFYGVKRGNAGQADSDLEVLLGNPGGPVTIDHWNGIHNGQDDSWQYLHTVLGSAMLLCIGTVLLSFLRRTSRTETVFRSPAKSGGSIRITHQHPDGPLVDHPAGPVEVKRRLPGPGSFIRQRMKQKAHDKVHKTESGIRSTISWDSVSGNTSATTLIGDEDEHGQHHDGLIELKQTGDTRNFHDPDTGETLHLSPWKSTHDSSDEEHKENTFGKLKKGTISHKITEMSIGSAILGGGKAAETSLHKDAQDEVKHHPQQMGDTLTELVANAPSSTQNLGLLL